MAPSFLLKGKSNMKKSLFSKLLPYLFIAPTFIMMAVFSYYAIGRAVVSSFTDSTFGIRSSWVGWENYIQAFHDDMFRISFRNQVCITLTTVFNSVFFPLMAAELIFFIRRKRMAEFVKTAFVVPMLVPSIVIILMWKYLYNPNFGFNTILKALGLGQYTQNWLNNDSTALISIILIGFPYIAGMYFLIMHTGMNMIGEELYEAAIIDGATPMQVVRFIHVPNLKPYIKTIVTLSMINSLSGFGNVFATTGGGPGYSTMIPALQMYKIAFGDGKFGYASALGVLLMIAIVVLTLFTRRLFGKEE